MSKKGMQWNNNGGFYECACYEACHNGWALHDVKCVMRTIQPLGFRLHRCVYGKFGWCGTVNCNIFYMFGWRWQHISIRDVYEQRQRQRMVVSTEKVWQM